MLCRGCPLVSRENKARVGQEPGSQEEEPGSRGIDKHFGFFGRRATPQWMFQGESGSLPVRGDGKSWRDPLSKRSHNLARGAEPRAPCQNHPWERGTR